MSRALLFDFFGTLVDYRAERVGHGYPGTVDVARSLGFAGDHDEFVELWDTSMHALEAASKQTLREFSMREVVTGFLDAAGLSATAEQADALVERFIVEWFDHVTPIDGVSAMLRRLASDHRIAVVSNTHDRRMVPDMLERMGVGDIVDPILLSVDHGWAKPHPSIYEAALHAVDTPAEAAVFIGDNPLADHAGPVAAGMRAYLIDPSGNASVPPDDRLDSVLDLEAALAADSNGEC